MNIGSGFESFMKAAKHLLMGTSYVSTIGEVIQSLMGHKVADSAHNLAKLFAIKGTGGSGTYLDEANMIKARGNKLTRGERRILRGFDLWMQQLYGDGTLGVIMAKRFGNKSRPALLHLEASEQVVVDKIARVDAGGHTVHDEVQRVVNNEKDYLIPYLKELVQEIRVGSRTATGNAVEKLNAGHQQGYLYFKSTGMPIPEFVELTRAADEIISTIPAAVAYAKDVLKVTVRTAKDTAVVTVPEIARKVATTAQSGHDAFLQHSSPEKIRERRQARPWHSRSLASFLFD